MGALTQTQTDRLNELDKKNDLNPEELKELNILQKIHSGEDTDADNKGGDNNPQDFEYTENANERSLTEEEKKQHDAVNPRSAGIKR